jgi:uncharacterized lipoprotein YddW (UPF0748 family)
MTLLPLLLIATFGAEQVLDTFQYADLQTARQAWVAAEGTPPVTIALEDRLARLCIAAPFATDAKLKRMVVDHQVPLNLAAPGEFLLELAVEPTEAAPSITLYFRSGSGWYGCSMPPKKGGWQTLHFAKSAFSVEGTPRGWQQIDGIRIAAWRGTAHDATVRLRRLTATTHEVALIVPASAARRGDSEQKAAHDVAARVAEMLKELGLGTDLIEESALEENTLGDRKVAVLPYTPHLSEAAATALEQFVDRGGKVLVCYTLPPRLGRWLGFGNAKHVQQERPGQFAEIRFDADGIEGLPAKVEQASWNISAAEPLGHQARVIGQWYDDTGKSAGKPALLLSDRGAFFSHIILEDDREGKKEMLAAILGHFAPMLWPRMAQAAMDRTGNVGHCESFDEVEKYVSAQVDAGLANGARALTLRQLEQARSQSARAGELLSQQKYAAAIGAARMAHEALALAYMRAAPSPKREGRAVWNHSGTGAYPGDWDRSAKELAGAGFNMILPNMLWAGLAHYPSDILPRSATFAQYGDQIAQCLAAAKKYGLEVHVWKVCFNLSGAPKEFAEKLRREGRTQVTVKGQPQDWLCPSHPENRRLELESMLEVARNYAVDGLHFDYIRYPHGECCYCDGCRQRFEAETGRQVANWPKDCYSGSRCDEYHQWRCKQITTLLAAVRDGAKKLRPQLKISAAVFGAYPSCRESVGQDWPEWIKAGYLDFVCPMDYTPSDEEFRALVGNQLKRIGGRIPVYPGIGATASRSALSPDRVVGQIHDARSLGAAGFTIFNFSNDTAQTIVPGVGLGAGSKAAVPSHR